ncbi:hypothetical protein SAMN05192588_1080 [Nonlabens sp. Hel1_33_55]|uniref:DNA topoisomerase IV n=1 Tax=Nonlabens sp. Hel1_33_55 TaxID=1336802 RepID=UPI000875D52B|nr:DNA topoisomerase IV [Nonlabens sp. Hel1_33_55]SCY08868.1 hypothetical protein SAMN05192588_1080 [Nonlabens sp. Hel1_33_55]
MRQFVFLLLITFCITACSNYKNTRECDDFRTGTFVWEQDSGGNLLKTTFERTENIQIETFEGVTDTSRVEWINACEWRIIPINPKTNADSRAYLFKILNTSKDSYSFEFKQSGRDQIYYGTAKKLD